MKWRSCLTIFASVFCDTCLPGYLLLQYQNAEELRTFFLCKSMTASVFFFFFFFAGSFFIQFRCVFLHRMCTSVCQYTCVYMHMCSDRQCIYVSLQSPLIYHAISAKRMLSFQFFLSLFSSFFSFFFFLLTTAYSCVKLFVSTVVAGSLVMHHLLGSVMYALFSRMVASSHWRAFSVVSRSSIHSITLSQPRFFFFFQLLITQHQCSYIHVFTIFTERE